MNENSVTFTPLQLIPADHLIKVCKYRQGSECCRYIYFPQKERDFYCTKTILSMKKSIDKEVSQMTAQGDNCPGLPGAV